MFFSSPKGKINSEKFENGGFFLMASWGFAMPEAPSPLPKEKNHQIGIPFRLK